MKPIVRSVILDLHYVQRGPLYVVLFYIYISRQWNEMKPIVRSVILDLHYVQRGPLYVV